MWEDTFYIFQASWANPSYRYQEWFTDSPLLQKNLCYFWKGAWAWKKKQKLKTPTKVNRCDNVKYSFSSWWFQIFFIFTPFLGGFPFWPIFFKGFETTNKFLFEVSMFVNLWIKTLPLESQSSTLRRVEKSCPCWLNDDVFWSSATNEKTTKRVTLNPKIFMQTLGSVLIL